MNTVVTCSECGATEDARFYSRDCREAMLARSACFGCLFWLEKVDIADQPCSVRVNGKHYVIGPERTSKALSGFAGKRFVIRFHDGREVVTTNLWAQDRIPERFRDRLPDNAEFVAQQEPKPQAQKENKT